jgi:hypothetical protein
VFSWSNEDESGIAAHRQDRMKKREGIRFQSIAARLISDNDIPSEQQCLWWYLFYDPPETIFVKMLRSLVSFATF